MIAVAFPQTCDPPAISATRQATLSLLGDTFAIHEVGERIARVEVFPLLEALSQGGPLRRLTLLASAQEITRRFDIPEWPAGDDSLVTLLPALESAADTIRESLTSPGLDWGQCQFESGLLEHEGHAPVAEGELRILVSPPGGVLTLSGEGLGLPRGTHHAVSMALAPGDRPVSDSEIAPVLIQRSLSGDLLATYGLVSFLRRNPEVVRDLSLDTLRQIEFEFPHLVEEGILSP